MAFRSRDLSVLAYANGFTLWHYRTQDGIESLLGLGAESGGEPGYFGSANDMLRAGDQIIVNMWRDERPAIVNLVVDTVGQQGTVGVRAV